MIINKLYSSNDDFFEPIEFHEGLNIILGERSEGSEKRNGVGKSISIEFINFCLLKDIDKSRLKFLPKQIISQSHPIFLDIEIEGKLITIKRDLKKPHEVVIYDGIFCHELEVSDAKKYLLSKFQFRNKNLYCTFRNLVNPLIRDERCEFKSIPSYSDTNLKVPVDYSPHFFYLGIDSEPLRNAMTIKSEINADNSQKLKVKNQIETILGIDIKEAKSEYNKLKEERDELQIIVDSGAYDAFDIMDEEYQNINSELNDIRIKLSSLQLKIRQAKKLTRDEDLDTENIRIIYDKIQNGLGEIITRNIDEVISFKKRINDYTKNIAFKKIENFNKEILSLKLRREYLVREREIFSHDNNSIIAYDLKELIAKLAIKNELVNELKAFLKKLDDLELSIKTKKVSLDKEKLLLETTLMTCEDLLNSFEKVILDAHKKIFDDYSASFNIKVNNTKEIVSFDLRIKEDGGHSNERAKVFIYDFSMLLHDRTYSNHLGFLVHDNIFDNDNDTLEKSLNYINDALLSFPYESQYILTINSDKLIGLKLNFDIDDYVRAVFTKEDKFLKRDYEESK